MSGQGITTGPLAGVDFTKTIFLVADDKAFFRDMVHTALQRAGAREVKHATSIEVAIQQLGRYGQQIGCVICDWDMAPVGGLELLRLIRCRSLAKTPPRTPVVILTGKADSAAVKSALAMDVNGFAVAPLSFEKLVKTIANAMNRTWNLQLASHYGAVPAVIPSLAPPPGTSEPTAPRGVLRTEQRPTELAAAKPMPRREVTIGEAKGTALKNVHMCILTEVQPGDILARDILDGAGHLLLKTGTELKSSLIDRLRGVAGEAESYHLWVGERP